ncbi:hypothetical protein C5E41_23655 [Nocardia nova]|nr:hypothetical protein C5E41_23655 [Nocardia nova]
MVLGTPILARPIVRPLNSANGAEFAKSGCNSPRAVSTGVGAEFFVQTKRNSPKSQNSRGLHEPATRTSVDDQPGMGVNHPGRGTIPLMRRAVEPAIRPGPSFCRARRPAPRPRDTRRVFAIWHEERTVG